jgi:anti-sigma regulatory factor (Ser/Thr protein kinase)
MNGTRPMRVTGTDGISQARRYAIAVASEKLGPPRLRDVALVVSELVSNALEHGRGHADLTVELIDDGVEITVGSPADGELEVPDAPPPTSDHRGRGLRIVNSLTDAMVVSSVDDEIEIVVRIEP